MLKKLILLFLCLDILVLGAVYLRQSYVISHPLRSRGKEVELQLTRGPFTVYDFAPKSGPTRAIITFGSGDGGWSNWEESVAQVLRGHGYQVIGIDSVNYAHTDYDLHTLQADFGIIADHFRAPFGKNPPPVVVGGWSMGAAQAVAAAGGPNPPPGLSGIIAISLCARGRYGLRLSDQMDISPTGAGTFSMQDFAPTISQIRVVQMHGAEDIIDSRAWLKDLPAPHLESDMADAGHRFNGANDAFLLRLDANLRWILHDPSAGALATRNP